MRGQLSRFSFLFPPLCLNLLLLSFKHRHPCVHLFSSPPLRQPPFRPSASPSTSSSFPRRCCRCRRLWPGNSQYASSVTFFLSSFLSPSPSPSIIIPSFTLAPDVLLFTSSLALAASYTTASTSILFGSLLVRPFMHLSIHRRYPHSSFDCFLFYCVSFSLFSFRIVIVIISRSA